MNSPPRDGRLEQYRESPDSESDLAVELLPRDGKRLRGQIVDATARGIGLLFPVGIAPAIPIGEQVTLIFTSRHLHAPLSVEAAVASRHEMPDQRRRYGLQFLSTIRTTASALNRLFNHRRHYRVSVDPRNPVSVAIKSAEQPGAVAFGKALMTDISCGGIGILVDPAVERTLSNADTVRVLFVLPGIDGSFDCVTHIRSRRSRAEQIHWGLEFDRQATGFAAMEDRIQKYVSHRQQEELDSKVKG